jgi:hypothetical protein
VYESIVVGSYLRGNDLACYSLPTISNLPRRRKLYSSPSDHEYGNVQYVNIIFPPYMLQILFFAPDATPDFRNVICHFPGVGCDRGTCLYLIFIFVRRTVLEEQCGVGGLTTVFTFIDNYLFIFSGLCV